MGLLITSELNSVGSGYRMFGWVGKGTSVSSVRIHFSGINDIVSENILHCSWNSILWLTCAFVGCAPPWNSIVPYASVGWGRVCLFGNHASPGEPGSMPRIVGCVWRACPQQHLYYSKSKQWTNFKHDSSRKGMKNSMLVCVPIIKSSSICSFNTAPKWWAP